LWTRVHNARVLSKLEQRFHRYTGSGPPASLAAGPCLDWSGARTHDGWPVFWVKGRGTIYAHRVAWELAHGPIPAGRRPERTCGNRLCVAAAHMRLVPRYRATTRTGDP
jgi:hypothetical protein